MIPSRGADWGTGMTTPTDEAWVPTQHEVQRALEAGVIHLSVPARGTVCSHNSLSVYKYTECRKAILDYERKQGREPTDPEAWKTDRDKEIEEERGRAYKALVVAPGPQGKAWYISLITLMQAGLVYYLAAYVKPAGGHRCGHVFHNYNDA
jgi:hypothetical protein